MSSIGPKSPQQTGFGLWREVDRAYSNAGVFASVGTVAGMKMDPRAIVQVGDSVRE